MSGPLPREQADVLNRLHVSAIYEGVLIHVFAIPSRVLDELRGSEFVTIDAAGVWRITPAGETARRVVA